MTARRTRYKNLHKYVMIRTNMKLQPNLLQIAQLLDTDSRNLRNCSLREGSVIVAMGVEGYDELEAAELEKATQDLQQMIADGQVGEIRMDVTFGRELHLLRLHRGGGVHWPKNSLHKQGHEYIIAKCKP